MDTVTVSQNPYLRYRTFWLYWCKQLSCTMRYTSWKKRIERTTYTNKGKSFKNDWANKQSFYVYVNGSKVTKDDFWPNPKNLDYRTEGTRGTLVLFSRNKESAVRELWHSGILGRLFGCNRYNADSAPIVTLTRICTNRRNALTR